MRNFKRATIALSAFAWVAASADAQQAEPATPAASSAPPAATGEAPADPLGSPIAQRIAGLKARVASADERTWADGIAAAYADRGMKPIWVNGSGLQPRARAVMDEIRRADEWGLSAKSFALPDDPGSNADPERLAAAEIKLSVAALKYAAHARGGRVDPSELSLWLDQKPRPVDGKELLSSLATAEDAGEALRKLHPQHPQFAALRAAYLKARTPRAPLAEEPVVTIPPGPLVKPGDRHPDVALVRQRLKIPAETGEEEVYDGKLEAAVRAFMIEATGKKLGTIGKEVRAALNKTQKPKEDAGAPLRRLLVNMERWRWLPDDLGHIHVWNNLPEFETRVVKTGKVVHQERIIIGKADTQTPVFSDRIRFVVFRPEWGVPPSLKVKDLLPKLQYGDYSVLEKRDMRISVNGKTVDPGQFDWGRVDIRKIPIVQEAGESNPLGNMKFMFPNKHDVYMHDTPTKNLFNSPSRMFSSGCIRVRNPKRFAELMFTEGGGMAISDISARIAPSAEENQKVDLERAIPVHNTYFTAMADEQGEIKTFADIYGHDRRIAAVLIDGRSAADVARDDPALKLKETVDELATSGRQWDLPPTRETRRGGYWGYGGYGGGYGNYQGSGRYGYRRGGPRGPQDFFGTLFGN